PGPAAEGLARPVPDQDVRSRAPVHPASPDVPRPALAVRRSPGLRFPLPPQAARLSRAEPPTPDGPSAPARAGTPRRGPHPGRACPGRTGPVTLPAGRYLGD